MASHLRDDLLHGHDHPDTHASANRWRHQESESFSRHAAPRDVAERSGSRDLADFLNTTRIEPPKTADSAGGRSVPIIVAGNVQNDATEREPGAQHDGGAIASSTYGSLDVRCGPLLNYRRMENKTWYGSVLIVTRGGGLRGSPVVPELRLRYAKAKLGHGSSDSRISNNNSKSGVPEEGYGVDSSGYGNGQQQVDVSRGETAGAESTNGVENNCGEAQTSGTKLYSDRANTFWRFDLKVPMQEFELHCEYEIPGLGFEEGKKTDKQSFFVPAISQSMRIMFHSCNGFSVGTDEDAWSGAALWNDVLRVHEKAPFHVMYFTIPTHHIISTF